MGIANVAWQYPTSFKRRCSSGETTKITVENTPEGLAAIDHGGTPLFSLTHDKNGFKMLDSHKQAVLTSRPGTSEGAAVVEDRTGRILTTMSKQCFLWDGAKYAWKTKGLLSFVGNTTFALQHSTRDGKVIMATLKLPADLSSTAAELTVEPALGTDGLPLGLLIFQALIIEYQWDSLKVTMKPFKRLAFSSTWV